MVLKSLALQNSSLCFHEELMLQGDVTKGRRLKLNLITRSRSQHFGFSLFPLLQLNQAHIWELCNVLRDFVYLTLLLQIQKSTFRWVGTQFCWRKDYMPDEVLLSCKYMQAGSFFSSEGLSDSYQINPLSQHISLPEPFGQDDCSLCQAC